MLFTQVVIIRRRVSLNPLAGREQELTHHRAKSSPKMLKTARMSQLQEELTLPHPSPPPERIIDTPGWIQLQVSPG